MYSIEPMVFPPENGCVVITFDDYTQENTYWATECRPVQLRSPYDVHVPHNVQWFSMTVH